MNNTTTQQEDKLDREQYLEACRNYAAATSPMDGLALAQLAIAAKCIPTGHKKGGCSSMIC